MPATDTDEPILANARRLIEEPIRELSKIDILDPKREELRTLSVEPLSKEPTTDKDWKEPMNAVP
jgi:hypothetical protein